MISRRNMFKYTLVAGAGLFLTGKVDPNWAFAESPDAPVFARLTARVQEMAATMLNSIAITKYVTPLLIPPAMPEAGKVKGKDGKDVDYYEIAIRQFQQQILPAGMPKTTVWGYGPSKVGKKDPQIFNAPSLTIEAQYQRPVRIKWSNQLRENPEKKSAYLPHLLPVDPTLHWANPPGGEADRDTRPTFTSTPGPYTGPVPMVTHVHGAIGVGDESDGYAEAWWLPDANDIPSGYAKVGTWNEFFKKKAKKKFDADWGPGFAVFEYPNDQRASTIWYHDHALGMTRLNVYAGPAGFFIIRGGPAGDAEVCDSRSGKKATLPGPAPAQKDKGGTKYYEIPMAIQDRAFNDDGSLFYPDTRAYFGDVPDPITSFIPDSDVAPIWNPEFFGNCIIVNGNTWPFLQVEQRRYRFRLLNGCDARTLVLKFDHPDVKVWQIGNETGFLVAPVNMNATPPDPSVADGTKAVLLMGGAERADVIVDFTAVPAGTAFRLLNIGPEMPFNGFPIAPEEVAPSATTGQVMEFRVVAMDPKDKDKSTPPEFLVLPAIPSLPAATYTRKLVLAEMTSSAGWDVPVEARLGVVNDAGNYEVKKWMDLITENPAVGATEIWEFYNTTVDAHPMHIHEVAFQVLNRQLIDVTDQDTVLGTGTVELVGGTERGPKPWELGRKDTVIALPGEVTRVKATFASAGQFVWHCHIVEHEDNEMMRPFRIGPLQDGQPSDGK